MSNEQRIVQERDFKKWGTLIPNIYDDMGLTPHEFRLLVHYARVGNCWESVSTTSKVCCMSKVTVISCRRSLEKKGLIKVSLSKYGTLSVTVVDVWRRNFEHYADRNGSKEGKEAFPKMKRVGSKEGNEEYNSKNYVLRIEHEEQQQQRRARTAGARAGASREVNDTDAVVAVLKEAGLNEGPAMRLAREGVITLEVARAWREWLADPPNTFRDPLGYAARCLALDPTALPPRSRRKKSIGIDNGELRLLTREDFNDVQWARLSEANRRAVLEGCYWSDGIIR